MEGKLGGGESRGSIEKREENLTQDEDLLALTSRVPNGTPRNRMDLVMETCAP